MMAIERLKNSRALVVMLAGGLAAGVLIALLIAGTKPVEAASEPKAKIAFTSQAGYDEDEDIYVMDADGNNKTRLTTDEKDDTQPIISACRSKITQSFVTPFRGCISENGVSAVTLG